ncbi:hypothetical protein PP641_gp053 [Arthrobacter phage SilentRX]|uniref:Uncharacterized protein n=1 Tax=Arthrobacter phage SilentRX TaxID=2836091 RepID=A0A8F3IP64_9CAUD|nr:hypothetical protein PP641_gp053 [Arthrobacter phage SilentRX]QWY82793.1 hypothetical protein SEA_SILENTRX_53 [Arthrobacter phage SilentRX]
MYVELPLIKTSTPADRLQALKDSRELLTATPGESKPAIFGGGSVETVYAPETAEMIRLAEYITTGHDYADSHPKGKRRPIIKETHIHVHPALLGEDGEVPDAIRGMVDHLIEHLENGDFDAKRDEDPRADADN